MGPAADPMAVVDARGRVQGVEGLMVADASIMPVVPRANTNIPSAVVAEKIAALIADNWIGANELASAPQALPYATDDC
jgi:choline dehydrogenase-like flavoprotein